MLSSETDIKLRKGQAWDAFWTIKVIEINGNKLKFKNKHFLKHHALQFFYMVVELLHRN